MILPSLFVTIDINNNIELDSNHEDDNISFTLESEENDDIADLIDEQESISSNDMLNPNPAEDDTSTEDQGAHPIEEPSTKDQGAHHIDSTINTSIHTTTS